MGICHRLRRRFTGQQHAMTRSRVNDEGCNLPMGLQPNGYGLGKDRRRPKGIVATRDKDDFRMATFDWNGGRNQVPSESPQALLKKFKVANRRQAVHRKQRFCRMWHEWEGRSMMGEARTQWPFEAVPSRAHIRPHDRRGAKRKLRYLPEGHMKQRARRLRHPWMSRQSRSGHSPLHASDQLLVRMSRWGFRRSQGFALLLRTIALRWRGRRVPQTDLPAPSRPCHSTRQARQRPRRCISRDEAANLEGLYPRALLRNP